MNPWKYRILAKYPSIKQLPSPKIEENVALFTFLITSPTPYLEVFSFLYRDIHKVLDYIHIKVSQTLGIWF